ncbi:MAG: VanZ family protein [Cellulosilyticum sp.]|nr:VanZ family protein [Cellulosilyticum sp.]
MDISEIIRYVYVTIGVAILISIPTIYIRKSYFKKQREVYHWKYEVADICFIFYLICLFQITALRFGGIGWDLDNMMSRNTRVNGVPLKEIWIWMVNGRWWHLFYNVIGNCAWFVPLGLILPALYRGYRKHLWRTVFIGLIVSTFIEILQFILCTGVTDIDDVIFNTIGTAMGYMLWASFDWIRSRIK